MEPVFSHSFGLSSSQRCYTILKAVKHRLCWHSDGQILESDEQFGPPEIAELVESLIEEGTPAVPIDLGSYSEP